MHFSDHEDRPLFQQVTDQIADLILSQALAEGDQIPSTTEISHTYKINPATVLKGINQLVTGGYVEKRRGIGMFVAPGAHERLVTERRTVFLDQQIESLVAEARRLGLSASDITTMIERKFR